MESTAAHRTLKAGEMLNWYRIDGVLGRGGFGVIYRATDTNLDHTVAIKEYIPTGCATREGDTAVRPLTREHGELYRWGLERFIKEARNLVRFKHPNIVRVMSVFQQNNTAYMVMEFEAGIDLGHYLARDGATEETSLKKLIGPVCEGLAEVHRHGFIHRDIKPANILVRPDGSPVLLDFGSARDATLNNPDGLTALVTVGYAPLEQYDSGSDEQQGPWTDIYALGGVLYHAISGSDPIDSARRGSALLNGGRDPLIAAATLGRGRYSASFLAAIDWALEFRIADRPQTLADWMPALVGTSRVGPRPARAPALGTLSDFVPDAAGEATRVVHPDDAMSRTSSSGLDPQTVNPVTALVHKLRFSIGRPRLAVRRPRLTIVVLTVSVLLVGFVWWTSRQGEPTANGDVPATSRPADASLAVARAQQAARLADLERREQAFAEREAAALERSAAERDARLEALAAARAEQEEIASLAAAREREAKEAAEAARLKRLADAAREFGVALDEAEAALDERRTDAASEAIERARATGFDGRRLELVNQRLQKVLTEMRRPVSDAEFDLVVRRFDSLKRAIEAKDRTVIDGLTIQSEQNALFRQLNDNFARLNMEITGIRVRNADKSVSANLRIHDMVRDNGDRAVPSDAFRDREIMSRLVDGEWTPIDW